MHARTCTQGNQLIRILNESNGQQTVSTLAGQVEATGFADGSGTNAKFNNPCCAAAKKVDREARRTSLLNHTVISGFSCPRLIATVTGADCRLGQFCCAQGDNRRHGDDSRWHRCGQRCFCANTSLCGHWFCASTAFVPAVLLCRQWFCVSSGLHQEGWRAFETARHRKRCLADCSA